ncbi:MAG: wax ester/triacylglycerol synthase family O-acyltransferase, partial [Wenzhouxiangellaceae bacterium]|nr:wax ester/triacylglycerol synthase family O-acyltransferase [Wenzhouxiangellaceae bacterium]
LSKQIPLMDVMMLLAESQSNPIHVCGLMLFEKPKGRRGLVREIVEAYRAARPTPPFDGVPELSGTHTPRWLPANDYDPRHHVQHIALPAGARYEDLLYLAGDLHETMLDRDRPLFRVWVIDQVPGGRFALFVKMHHAIVDGVSAARRVNASLRTTRHKGVPKPLFAVDVPVRKPRPPKAMIKRLLGVSTTATSQYMALLGSLRKGVWNRIGLSTQGSVPFAAHRGPMNEPVLNARTVATLSLPLPAMRRVGKHYGATLNDVAMTVIDAGVHRYLAEQDQPFEHRLVAMCPVSLRETDDASGGTKVSAVFVRMGAPGAPVAERLVEVAESMNEAKEDIRAMSRETALGYAAGMMAIAGLGSVTHADRVTRPSANLVISNIPGWDRQLYLNGAPLTGVYPVSAIAAGVGLNATVISCNGSMDFGFVGNGASLHNLPALAVHVEQAWRELVRVTP